MKLSLSGKLLLGGIGAYVAGEAMERLAGKLRPNKAPAPRYTPQGVIGYLTDEQVHNIQAYAEEHGIRWWEALEIFCNAWNLQEMENGNG